MMKRLKGGERQKGSLGPKPPCRGADSSQTGGWKLDIHGIRNKSQESGTMMVLY